MMRLRITWQFLFLFFLVGYCVSFSDVQAREKKPLITEKDAQTRAKQVSEVHYDLKIQLEKDDKTFAGTNTLNFKLSENNQSIDIDFAEGKVLSIEANGKSVPLTQYNGFFLTIPSSALVKGQNTVTIQYEHPYSRTGAGFYRFQDPEDKKVYVYTDFEPYDANLLFPCFDQPDIKATYALEVDAPMEWEVISSVTETSKEKLSSTQRRWTFGRSAKMSTYIFSLHAGPYRKWTSEYSRSGNPNIPLRLFARQSLAKFVNEDEWFDVTKKGFRFFEKYFDFPYPFVKYDQIIVPDFNAGAMENIAAVTFTEGFVHRGEETVSEKEKRANVILHEMAHMWFGNLVTMKWWDDLWLNESFATFMASLALAEGTEFKNAWQTFFVSDKGWAYWEDQLVTTHPIQAQVPDTDQAFANFDGITYGKGAAILKQLNFYLGPEKFRAGVRSYFKKHQYQNTVLDDFIGALAQASGKDLKTWTSEWLQNEGLNQIEAQFECHEGKIKDFQIIQSSASGKNIQRSHRTQVALYDVVNQSVQKRKSFSLSYQGHKTEVPLMNGQNCAAFVILNDEDHDYVKTKLDPRTLSQLQGHLAKVTDPLLELMLWESLWEMVRDSEFSMIEFSDLLLKNLGSEKDIRTAERTAQKFFGRRLGSASIFSYLPADQKNQIEFRDELNRRFEGLFYALLQQADSGSDFQKLWWDSFVRVALHRSSFEKLLGALKGTEKISGLEIDQDRRWSIIQRLHQIGYREAGKYLIEEEKRDSSYFGQKQSLASQVMVPDLRLKKKWFFEVSNPKTKRSVSELKTVMRHLFPPEQAHFKEHIQDDYFKNVVQFARKNSPPEFLESYADYFVPALCGVASTKRLSDFLNKTRNLPVYVQKAIKVSIDENERCTKVRSRAAREIAKSKKKE